MNAYLVLIVIISGFSFGLGWFLAHVYLKEEREDIEKACDEAIKTLEGIATMAKPKGVE